MPKPPGISATIAGLAADIGNNPHEWSTYRDVVACRLEDAGFPGAGTPEFQLLEAETWRAALATVVELQFVGLVATRLAGARIRQTDPTPGWHALGTGLHTREPLTAHLGSAQSFWLSIVGDFADCRPWGEMVQARFDALCEEVRLGGPGVEMDLPTDAFSHLNLTMVENLAAAAGPLSILRQTAPDLHDNTIVAAIAPIAAQPKHARRLLLKRYGVLWPVPGDDYDLSTEPSDEVKRNLALPEKYEWRGREFGERLMLQAEPDGRSRPATGGTAPAPLPSGSTGRFTTNNDGMPNRVCPAVVLREADGRQVIERMVRLALGFEASMGHPFGGAGRPSTTELPPRPRPVYHLR